ncbi:MAG TPA: hypothetical protein VNM91_01455 [Dehalococcoidia bacterium]|nr:hypothetical protein [Dehalococcoidia bacterium]
MITRGGAVSDDWKARILHARQRYDLRRGAIGVRTPMATVFRRMIQTVIQPAFQEVAEFARSQGVDSSVDLELGGVQPRAMFCIRPSGRSIRFELDPGGEAVREIEGVYHRPLGQRRYWSSVEDLQRQLTQGYARSAAAGIVQDHFRQEAQRLDP